MNKERNDNGRFCKGNNAGHTSKVEFSIKKDLDKLFGVSMGHQHKMMTRWTRKWDCDKDGRGTKAGR